MRDRYFNKPWIFLLNFFYYNLIHFYLDGAKDIDHEYVGNFCCYLVDIYANKTLQITIETKVYAKWCHNQYWYGFLLVWFKFKHMQPQTTAAVIKQTKININNEST